MTDSNQDQDERKRPDRAEREPDAPANALGLNSLGNQAAIADPALSDPSADGAGPGAPPQYPDTLLRDPGLGGRGNAPVRAALVQRMQQTYGNRTTHKMLQRLRGEPSTAGENDLARRIESKSGGGNPLDEGVQRKLESGLGADMSGVKVHNDAEASRLAQSVDPVTFTTGQDIFFREGAYNPTSPEGLKLPAHEATHIVQQAQGPVASTPTAGGVSVSDPSDRFEQEAAHKAEKVASESSAPSQAEAVASPKSSHAVQTQRAHSYQEEEGTDAQPSPGLIKPSSSLQKAVQRTPDGITAREEQAARTGDPEDVAGTTQAPTHEQHIPVQTSRISPSGTSLPVQRDGAKSGAAPAAKPTKGTTTINPVVPKTYKVTGKTLQEAVDSMGTRDEAGETTWEPKLSYALDDDGKVKSATITVTITETLPTWAEAAKLNKDAKKEWDRFQAALKKHEDGHVTRAKDKFKNSADRLMGKSEADAQAEFEKIKKEVQDDSDAYDTSNDHGKKEGTIIDVDAGAPKKPAAPAAPSQESTSTGSDAGLETGDYVGPDTVSTSLA